MFCNDAVCQGCITDNKYISDPFYKDGLLQCDVSGLMKELQSAQKQIGDLKSEVAQAQLPLLTGKAETLAGGARLLAVQVDGMDAKSLQVSPPPFFPPPTPLATNTGLCAACCTAVKHGSLLLSPCSDGLTPPDPPKLQQDWIDL